jgi:hypothetical protein
MEDEGGRKGKEKGRGLSLSGSYEKKGRRKPPWSSQPAKTGNL